MWHTQSPTTNLFTGGPTTSFLMSTNTPQTTQIMPTQSTLPIQPTSVGETPSGGGILQPTPVGPRATDKNYYRSLFGTISEPSTPPAPTINQNQSSHQIDSQNQQTNQNNLPNLATNNFPQFPNHINGNQFNQNNPQLNSVNSNNPQIAQINPNNPQFQPNNPQMNFNNPTNNVATNLNPISGGADFNFPLFTPNQVSAPAGAQAPFFQNMMMGNNGLNVQQAFPPAFMANNQVFTNTQTQPVPAQGFASNPNTNGFPASPAPVNASANIPVPSSNLPSAISPSSSNFNFPASPSSQNMVFPNSPPTKIASNPNANPISSVSLESFNFPPIVDDKNHLNSKSMNLSSQPASDLFNFPTFDSSTQIQPNPASSQSLFNPSGITNIGIGPSNPISSPTSSFGPLTPNILSSPSNPPSSHPIGSPASSFGPLTPLLPSSTLPPPSSPSLPIGSSTSSFGQGNNILSPSLPSSLNGSSATLQSTSGPIDSMSGIGSGILSPLDGQLSSQHASFPTTPFNSAPPQASNQLTENLFSQLLPTMSTAKTTQSASLHSNSIEALQKMTQGASLDGSGTGDLMQLFNKLIQAERYEEARDCKYQIECEKEIQLNLPLLQNAKFSGDLVKSLELREFIEKLQAKLVSQNQINSWRQPPSPDHKSFSQMQKEIEASAGKPRGVAFHQEFSPRIGEALKRGDLKTLVAIQLEAKNKFKVYQSGEPVIKNDHISRWETILKSLNAELKNAVQAFNEIKANFNLPQDKADLNTKFFSVPRTKTYINGVAEIYTLVKRLQKSICYFTTTQNLSTAHLTPYWTLADKSWNEFSEIYFELADQRLAPPNSANLEKENYLKYGYCCLCFLPISVDIPSLKWSGSSYHSSCANFYCNRISSMPPNL